MGRRDLFEVTQLVSIKSRAQVFTPSYFLQTLLPPESFVSTSVPRDLRWSEAWNGLIRKVVVLKKSIREVTSPSGSSSGPGSQIGQSCLQSNKRKGTAPSGQAGKQAGQKSCCWPLPQPTLPQPGRSQTISSQGTFKTYKEPVRTRLEPVHSGFYKHLQFIIHGQVIPCDFITLFSLSFPASKSFAGSGYF